MEELINVLIKRGLTPNTYYALLSVNNNTEPLLINKFIEFRILIADNYLTEDYKITEKGSRLIADIESNFKRLNRKNKTWVLGEDYEEKIKQYREIFPKIKLPSGAYARVTPNELEKKFIWFFNTYTDLNWDIVLKATKKYVSEYENTNYMYMRNSSYFISRESTNKLIVSDLANECYNYEETEKNNLITNKIVRKNVT